MTLAGGVPEHDDDAAAARTSAREAWAVLRREGAGRLFLSALRRFRSGDGFSHARALGFQVTVAAVPVAVAAMALTSVLETPSVRAVLLTTILELTPAASDPLVRRTLTDIADGASAQVGALLLAVASAVVALTTAMGQIERGANRLYGIRRDRGTRAKYARAFVMAGACGLPAMAGFVLLLTTQAFAGAVESVYAVDADTILVISWPSGVVLLLVAVTLMLRLCPRRRQPGWSFLALGSVVALALWTALTALLAGALQVSSDLGNLYGPLTGVLALLLWAQLTSSAVFLAFALCAELECAHERHHG